MDRIYDPATPAEEPVDLEEVLDAYLERLELNEGFFWALIGGAILGVIYYYVGLIALGLLMIVTRIVFTVLRYVFYNVYTLIAAIIIFILI
jgi:hypothetical protein